MKPTPEMLKIADQAADHAVEHHGAARGTHTHEIAREAALHAIMATAAHLSELAENAEISVPTAPGLPDGAAIARRAILGRLQAFHEQG